MYWEQRPGPELSMHVEMLWYTEGYTVPHPRERVLPSGRMQLILDLTETPLALMVGISTQYGVIETAGLQSIIGAVFRPGGTHGLLDTAADEFCNRDVALADVWGREAARLRECLRDAPGVQERFAVLEVALLVRARRRQIDLHPAVRHGLAQLQRAAHVGSIIEVTREAGLSRRRFSQLFREQVGLTPKLYCRLRRFQQVVQRIGCGKPVNWVDVALAGGYCDQAHLNHEFREFSGLTPGDYLASERPFLNHIAID